MELIRAGLKDADREIRILSAAAAGDIGDKGSSAELKNLLSDPSDPVRIKAAAALYKLGDPSGLAELRRIAATRPKLSDKVTAVERARAIARGTVRAAAVLTLGEIKDRESIPLLRQMVGDDDGRVGDACLISLAKMGDPSVKNTFISALESTKQEIRAKAAEALGDIGDPSAVAPLRKRLKDWDRGAKVAAVMALGKLKDVQSVPVLRELLWDKDDIVREKAAAALGLMGSPEAAPALEEMLKDPNGLVRIAAADSLYLLGRDSGREFLLGVLKTNEKDAKLKALAVLEKMATPADAASLAELLNDPDRGLAIAAARTLARSGARKK
ncbi:MAG: HEAT repeat domain-containing protein [Endomicrobiales bacterium]